MHPIKGLSAVVTGGASGLGAEISQQLAAEGVNLVINGLAHDKEGADKLAKELTEKYNVKVAFFIADMSQEADCTALINYTLETLGGVDIIISNAGWTRHAKWADLDAFPASDWHKSYAINVLAVMWLYKAAQSYMEETYAKTNRAGIVISTNSIASVRPTGSSMPYSVNKLAQIRLIESLALHHGPHARFNAVSPGLIITPFSVAYGEEVISGMKNRAPLKRESGLDDCAAAFLMMVKSDSITGQRIVVDAGLASVS
ncbi:hypothetical protein KCU89_g12824, partial [Aureobasidium melanogenum]